VAALDKTGTITQGKPVVTDIVPYEVREQELLQAAASLEKKSEHPLAQAIIEEAENRKIIISETELLREFNHKPVRISSKKTTIRCIIMPE
jgi:cation transport ATPase